MIPRVPLREALSDPNLLGAAIAGDSWKSWRTLLIASMGESLTEDERATFRALTGRDREPLQRVDQFAAVIGRRGGKSRAMATLACYLAGLCDHIRGFLRLALQLRDQLVEPFGKGGPLRASSERPLTRSL